MRGGWCGHLRRPVKHMRGRHQEAGRRVAPGVRVPGGFRSTECVIGIGHKVGDIGSYVGIRIVTRTTGDRRATGEGLSLIAHALVQRPGGSVVLPLFIFVDVREMIPYYRLRMPLISRSRIRKGIRCRKHVELQ